MLESDSISAEEAAENLQNMRPIDRETTVLLVDNEEEFAIEANAEIKCNSSAVGTKPSKRLFRRGARRSKPGWWRVR